LAEKNLRSSEDLRAADDVTSPAELRENLRELALRTAMRKRASGVPSYTVPEAAVLLSVSAELLYRLIRAGQFPAVRIRFTGRQGRYVVPAKAVERLLDDAARENAGVDLAEWANSWHAEVTKAMGVADR
jgi:DNA binding domain, excisionase family